MRLCAVMWTVAPAIPGDKGNVFSPASAVLAGRLYLTPKDGNVYRLTEKKDAWEVVGEFTQPRFVARMVAHGKALVVVAGATPNGMQASPEALTPAAVGKAPEPVKADTTP